MQYANILFLSDENINTELNMCIDSDDRLAPGAILKIKDTWAKIKDKGYAG